MNEREQHEWAEEVETARREASKTATEYANTAIDSIDRWLLALSGTGLSFAFAGILSGTLTADSNRILAWIVTLLALAMLCALVAKAMGFLEGLLLVRHLRDMRTNDPEEKHKKLVHLNWGRLQLPICIANAISFVFLALALLIMVISSWRTGIP